ncbi:S1/P1 nuclease [Lutibacter sp.]|uniref:S1/P1 nuclease n=1 Tax=Lutibacter sp. TaxID=1925666 RepID=UPI002732CFA0|nr:S1/P1 nuclease [Lutibacter sp.]MDP3312219.1 S1/P1 nuclease [Lutibacter sp.]
MKTIRFVCIIIAFFSVQININSASPDWGSTGHRTVGEIAENYINSKTKRKIAELLDGQSLAIIATFGDDIKSDKQYNYIDTWHYINMPFNVKYEDSEKNEKGDLVTGIEKCKQVLLDKNATKEDKAFHLKILTHLIGDLHQPMHIGRAEDKGGNTIQLQWFGDGTNLHRLWDSQMIDHYKMTYTELANNTNKISKTQVKFLQQGTVVDWVNEMQLKTIKVYGSVEVGEKLGYNYMYENFELARTQLQISGIRLAKVLNDLFS